MKPLTALILALALCFACQGCGSKSEQTEAIQVENPKEKAPPPGAAPGLPPGPAGPSPTATTRTQDGWTVTDTGLKYKDTKLGTGLQAQSGDQVTVHYKGWLDNGKVFDTSRKPGGQPYSFALGTGAVIRGWDEGVAGMKVGGVRQLVIPPELGYGSDDMGAIPPNSTLHFGVELLNVSRS